MKRGEVRADLRRLDNEKAHLKERGVHLEAVTFEVSKLAAILSIRNKKEARGQMEEKHSKKTIIFTY